MYKIGVLIPSTTRGLNCNNYAETHFCNIFLMSFVKTISKLYNYCIYLVVDDDDPIYQHSENKKKIKAFLENINTIDIKFISSSGIEKGWVTKMWNRAFKVAYDDGCDYFYQCGDDIEFLDSDWDKECVEKMLKNNNYGVTGPYDQSREDRGLEKFILTQTFVSRKHMELFNFYFAPELKNWFCDDWITVIYYKKNLCFPIKKRILNRGGEPRYDPTIEYENKQADIVCGELVQKYIDVLNKKPSSFCTMATKKCAHELVGLLLSLSIHHRNETIYVICDNYTKDFIENLTPQPRLNIVWHNELDKYSDLDRSQMTSMGIWLEFQMKKATIIKKALQHEKDTLFLDSDIVILDAIDEINLAKDIGVSPQFIAESNVKEVGYYNGGVLWTNNINVPDDWIKFSKTSRYFDQACIEDLVKKYNYFEFGENYNLQSWRFFIGKESKYSIMNKVSINNNKLYYNNNPLKFIHTHFSNTKFSEINSFFIKNMMEAKLYKELAIIFRISYETWILGVPSQPKTDKYYHKNDSFRELVQLIVKNNDDVTTMSIENTGHCWLYPNIMLYDRPTLDWLNNEIYKSSLILLGNGDINIEGKQIQNMGMNVKPWIFWPRHPEVLESLLDKKGVLNFNKRSITSLFIGNFENNVQKKFRDTDVKWDEVIEECYITKGSKHLFTNDEYLEKIRHSRFGLCLRGYGSKCHREVELMAFGTVPVVTQEVSIKSYMDPPVENKHYIIVKNPKDFKEKISKITKRKWQNMSKNCIEWYLKNVHSKNCWNTMISNILYS